MEIIKKLSNLRQLSGNAQLDYLKSICDDTLREVLLYTYDPDKTYKIDEGKYERIQLHKGLISRKKKQEFTENDWCKFKQILDKLVEKRAVTDSEVRNVKFFITDFVDTDIQSFLCMVLFKDLRLNIGIAKLQIACGIFLDKPQVQLAENYAGVDFESGLYSRKFDGKRMYLMNGIAYSRSNKPCKVAPISHILAQLKDCQKLTFDGEILYFDKQGNEDFQKGISLTSSDERTFECNNLYFVIFDMIPTEFFKLKQSQVPFELEYESLCTYFEAKESKIFGYSVLETRYPNILIARQEEDKSMLEYLRNLYGWEGLMYRNALAPYEFKRTKNLLKIKAMKDSEFTLEGVQIGTGRNENRLGAIYIRYKDNLVGVGSGFSDFDRDLIWQNAQIFLSSDFRNNFDVKVQYFEETEDADGKPSLRFPVFLCFRHKHSKDEMTVQQVLEFCGERDKCKKN